MFIIGCFIIILLLICVYIYCLFHFSTISRKIFHNYISLISLKTDWKHSFLEDLAEETRKYFKSPFISITTLKSSDTGRMLISSGDNTVAYLVDSVETEEYYLQKKKFFLFPFIYKTEDVLILKNQTNTNIIQKYNLNYSFMIPIYFSDKKEEFLISLYFKNKLGFFIAYLKYILVKRKLTYFYAGVFRNFIRAFESSAELLLEEIEDYIAISLDENANIVAWNKGAEKLFGYKSIYIIGKNFVTLFDFGEEDTFTKSLEILNIKQDVKYFATLKDKINIPIKVELKITKMLTVTSELAGYSVFVKDITKEEIFKDNIQQHSFINYTILENTQDSILILDSNDKIIFYNQKLRIILDNSLNLFGIPGKKIFPRHFGDVFEKTIDELKKSKAEFIDIDYCFDQKYYNIRFFRVHKNSNNDYGGVIVFFIDESIRMATMLELEEKTEALENINKNLLDALTSARIMQINLIPKELPINRIKINSIYELSDDLGGDFYYSENIIINDKEYNISFISDVSGHGISSSMMNVMVKEVYCTYIDLLHENNNQEPLEFLQLLNKKLLDINAIENRFITCVITLTNLIDKTIKICSAGHTLPYYIDKNKNVKLLDFKRAVPLGIIDNIYCDTALINYQEGDKLILYTDGFLDLFEINDLKPSDSALTYLKEHSNSTIDELKELILEKHQIYKKDQFSNIDDLTILMIQY